MSTNAAELSKVTVNISRNDLWKIAEEIVKKQKEAFLLPKDSVIGWISLEEDWFNYLEEKLFENSKINCHQEWQENEKGFESLGWIDDKTGKFIDLENVHYQIDEILDRDKFGNPIKAILIKS